MSMLYSFFMYNLTKGDKMSKLTNVENLDVMKKVFLTFKQQSKPTNVCNILFIEKNYKTFLTRFYRRMICLLPTDSVPKSASNI